MMGIILVLTLALAGFLFIPAGASAEGTANLKVVVRDNLLGTIDDAAVYCVNVHTGASYDLDWDMGDYRYEADVPPGTYQIFASADGFAHQMEPKVVYKLNSDNDENVQQIRLAIIGSDAMVRVHVSYNGDDVEGAQVHLFGADGIHLSKGTTPKGYANISAPDGEDLHLLVMADGKITYSDGFTSAGTMDVPVNLTAKPAVPQDSYMVIGLVMNGSVNIPGVEVTVWDANHAHYVPVAGDFEGAISLPLYNSVFHVVMEAEGYEPLKVSNINLEMETYYMPEGETFEMARIDSPGGKVTSVNLASDIQNPFISTEWTLDGNSRIYGTLNTFGSPRMQVAGTPFTADWMTVDGDEVNDTRSMIKNYGPAWVETKEFLKVNNVFYTADDEGYMVDVSGLGGDTFASGVNPVVTMTSAYTSDLDIKLGKDDIRVEIFTVLDGEVVDVILPADYEILGDFGDKAEFIDDNTSKLRVFEPIEFNAKVEEAPEAALRFDNSYEFYMVEPKMYIVKIEENITVTATGSSDAVGDIEKYMWGGLPNNIVVWDEDLEDFTPQSEMDLTEMEIITFQFTQNFNGYHNITLQVEDSSMKKSNIDWINLMPDNAAPTIEEYTLEYKETGENLTMEGEVYVSDEDLFIVFNASSAVDGKGEIVDWVWTFGDDTGSVNGEVVDHHFADPGQYNVTLRVLDAVGNEIELLNSTIIKVNDATPPMAVIKQFGDYDIGEPVEMNGTQSYDPMVGDPEAVVSWTWYYMSFGQNWTEQVEIGTQEVFNHTFVEPGQYIINLSVVDKAGLEGWVEKSLHINGPDLQALSITFTDPEVDNLRKGERAKISVAYTNVGTVKVDGNWTIRITDNGDKVKEEEITGTIEPGETHYYNFSYKLKEGDERLFVVYVDYGDTISEMSEDNNQIDTTVPVEPSEPIIKWWWFVIILIIVLVAYVVYMKYTRGEWGYEPVQRWWEKRNA
jgi:hypothetical protein